MHFLRSHARRRTSLAVLTGLLSIALACGGKDPVGPEGPDFTHPTGDELSYVTISGRPYGVTTNEDGIALVSRMDNSAVSRINLETGVVGPSIIVGSTPFWVSFAPSGNTAFVANHYGQSVGVISLGENSQVAEIPIVGDPLTVVVSPDGRRVYATNNGNSVFVIDPATRRVVKTITVSETPYGMAFHPTERILYVGGRDGQTISLIDLTTHTVTGEMLVGGRPHNIVVSPDGKELYVANEGGSLDVFSLTTNLRTHRIPIGPAHGMAMTPDGEQLYVSMPSAGAVVVIDRATKEVVQEIQTEGRPRKIAFSYLGDVALITNEHGWVDIVR